MNDQINDQLEALLEVMSLDEFLEFMDVLSLERRKMVYKAMMNHYHLLYSSVFCALDFGHRNISDVRQLQKEVVTDD